MNKDTFQEHCQQITQRMLDILFPPHCSGCKKMGTMLCNSCLRNIPPLPPPICTRCGRSLSGSTKCMTCHYHPLQLSGLRAISTYQEPLRSCIHDLKYSGKTRLAKPLGHLLAHYYHYYGMQADYIVPVPLHPERQRQRGYNHAHLLARICANEIGIPLRNDLLVRHRSTAAQVGLTEQQRYQNVAGAFTCFPGLATNSLCGRTIVIIDDVCTTGATLEQCAAPLFAAGARTVSALVLARQA